MIELPDRWEWARIEDVIAHDGLFSDGDWVESKDQDPNGQFRLIQLADIGDGRFLDKSQRFVNTTTFRELNCTEVLYADVLVARMPDPLGRACLMPILPQRCITVVDIAIIRPGHDSVAPRWLMHFINSPDIRGAIELLASGSTRRRISRRNLGQINLRVPPTGEQKCIAVKLDALLARVNTCRKRLDSVPLILKNFRKAVLSAAVSGQLSEDWRYRKYGITGLQSLTFGEEKLSVPDSWECFVLTNLINPVRPLCYGVIQPGEEVDGGVPLIRVQDLDRWRVNTQALRSISTKIDAEYRRSRVQPGDLLISVVGTIGRTAIVPDGLEVNIARAIARIVCRDGVSAQWVNIWLSSDPLQWWLIKSAREVARKTLNLSELGATSVALPPEDEQYEIVRRVKTLFTFADRFEARINGACARVDRLTPALLAKAFRGELVPQDLNDEPASTLLERIRSQRVLTTTKQKEKGIKVKIQKAKKRDVLAVLREANRAMSTEDLFVKSGFDEESIDEFYEQIRNAWNSGEIQEQREGIQVRLEAIKS